MSVAVPLLDVLRSMVVGLIDAVIPVGGDGADRVTVLANGRMAVTVIVEVTMVPGAEGPALGGLSVMVKFVTVLSKLAVKTRAIGTGVVVPSPISRHRSS